MFIDRFTGHDIARTLAGAPRLVHARGIVAGEDQAGDEADTCHIVVEGVLASYHSLPGRTEQIVGYHLPGDVCGLSAVSRSRRDHGIKALAPSASVSILGSSLADLATRSPPLCAALLRQMSVDAAVARQWIANLGLRSARQRVAHLVCEIQSRLSAIGFADDPPFKWFGTQADLAAATGLSLVHLNKTLAGLRKEELVDWNGTVAIRDSQRLRCIAGFDPSYLCLGQQKLGRLLLQDGAHGPSGNGSDASRPRVEGAGFGAGPGDRADNGC